jgi:hypothetical protein
MEYVAVKVDEDKGYRLEVTLCSANPNGCFVFR